MDKYIEINKIIDDYIDLMEKLIIFEETKLQAVHDKNNEQLDSFLKEEQAYLLKLRGLDQKREALQRKLGIEGLTYRQIIDSAEGSERTKLEASYAVLSSKTTEFKSLIDTIKTYIELRMHTIDSLIEKFGAAPSQQNQTGIYDKISNQSSEEGSNYSSRFQSTKV